MDEGDTDGQQGEREQERKNERALKRPTRIMIVDDDPGMRALIDAALEEAPGRYEVVAECRDGIQAIKTGRQVRPEVVLLDIDMPKMDGLEALPVLKNELPEARVVILSGSCTKEDFEHARAEGAVACLTKTVAFTKLIDCLDMVLKEDVVDPDCAPIFR